MGDTTCNDYGGDFKATDDGNVRFLPTEMTAVGCPGSQAVQEEGYTEALSEAASYEMLDGSLRIRDGAGVSVLVYAER